MQIAQSNLFNRRDVIASGWYWLLTSSELKKRTVRAVKFIGYELVVFRGDDGTVAALDAYCPHMGAHLSEGKVEGNQLRCFFHNWRFDSRGACTDIPCLNGNFNRGISTKSWTVQEKHGLIWIWLGEGEPVELVPEPPELFGKSYEYSLGKHFHNRCHPNVVMINAIDEQHFKTVHHLPGHILSMANRPVTSGHIEFRNMGKVPNTTVLGKIIGRFYRQYLTYNLDYWYGSTGTVCFGPDFLHLYLMFALRLTSSGQTEGYTIAFAKRRRGWLRPLNWLILFATKIAANYFGAGDNRVFETIRFRLGAPISADRTVLAFFGHLDTQRPYSTNLTEFPLTHEETVKGKNSASTRVSSHA